MKREAGILLAISSLPSKYGIGCFSKEAYKFVDWLRSAGQSFWQILPMGPTGYGDSPYQSFSTFAGNPYFIDLEDLVERGWIKEASCKKVDFGKDAARVDYEKLYRGRYELLYKAYEKSEIYKNPEFQQFLKKNEDWIYDYSLFMAVKDHFGGIAWTEWAEDIRNRWDNAMDYYREKLYYKIEFHQFLQFIFFAQWKKLRAYANENGIKIIGDIPIYVAMDSADTWANPELFQLDGKRFPTAVAGCPPDGFSPTGQLWGNPLYNWTYHAKTGYAWWIERMRYCYDLYDVVRIDHFRGFDEYYSIPYGEETAVNGHWEKGPGIALFNAIKASIGEREVIAEDLGFVTDSVREMVRESGFPNMKVLEFAFDARDTGSAKDYLPHNYPENCVAYTGTHDNETLVGWWKDLDEPSKKLARKYMCDEYTPDAAISKSMIALVMRSAAKLVVVPMQDYMGLDNTARMNQPSTLGNNWMWRLKARDLTKKLGNEILDVTTRFGRV